MALGWFSSIRREDGAERLRRREAAVLQGGTEAVRELGSQDPLGLEFDRAPAARPEAAVQGGGLEEEVAWAAW
jgi:hypothetical protein